MAITDQPPPEERPACVPRVTGSLNVGASRQTWSDPRAARGQRHAGPGGKSNPSPSPERFLYPADFAILFAAMRAPTLGTDVLLGNPRLKKPFDFSGDDVGFFFLSILSSMLVGLRPG